MPEIDNTSEDFKQVQSLIRGEVEKYASEAFAKQQSPIQTQTEQQVAQKQLHDLISPFVDPGVNEAKLTAADARDYVDFYNSNDVEASYKKQVETTFNELKKIGRPLPRADIMKHMLGDEYVKNPDQFIEKQQARKKELLDRANSASDFGASSIQRGKIDAMFANPESMTVDEIEKALDGVTF